ncbi:dosage compensation protein dpy-30-like [Paramacrobiotus metropolitanus]|uniref:dosage compensation protein dpy-30-like n=1 Tax=Paramacrobiotus metropolitanus TaxID=2943436 RepID=UPI002445ABBB|nr:dosage compensation protein dpy-30-like [Paramacrobiotus metropolitanus]
MQQPEEIQSETPSTNPFDDGEHPAPSTTNPFGHDHEMDNSEPTQQPATSSSEVSSGQNDAETLSGSSASTNPPPQASAEEQGRYDDARKKMQSEVINGNSSSTPGSKRKTPEELAKLPTRSYLDETVVPCLLVGMSELARQRPARPLEYLAKFLLREQEQQNLAESGGDAPEEQKKDTQSGSSNKVDAES